MVSLLVSTLQVSLGGTVRTSGLHGSDQYGVANFAM